MMTPWYIGDMHVTTVFWLLHFTNFLTFWFLQDKLRTHQLIDLKFSGMISHGMTKNTIDFGGGHLGFVAAIFNFGEKMKIAHFGL